jgi:DNA-binding CsgD family transcriptional regulator
MIDEEQTLVALTNLARDIGEPNFHLRLLELVGAVLPHDMGWIVRYRAGSEPDVLYTKAIEATLVDYYLQMKPNSGDPYLCSWRSNSHARVETMDAALPLAIDRNFYAQEFRRKAEFTDELAVFLPVPGASCISLFLERRDRCFTGDDLNQVQRLFPAMLDFHQTHMRLLFANLSHEMADRRAIEDCAISVLDRSGRMVFSTPGWRELQARDRRILALLDATSVHDAAEIVANVTLPLRLLTLDEMNPIAPGGVLIYAAEETSLADAKNCEAASAVIDQLTPRERDIMLFTLEGLSTGAIAQRLGIAKGSIKNCRLRMYRKFGVTSERAMISAVMPFTSQLKARLETGERNSR